MTRTSLKIAGLTSAAAMLAGLAAVPAAAQTEGSWTGPYFGGRIGYGVNPGGDGAETVEFDTGLDGTFGDTVRTGAGADAFSTGFCGGGAAGPRNNGCTGDRDGVEWAVHAGYDYQLGSNFVVGLVGEYGRSTVRDRVTAFSTTPASYTLERRLRDNAAIRARAGFTFADTLVYGTGGGAWGKIRNRFTTTNGANAFTNNGNDNAYGYQYGGGLEHRVSDGFSIGVQYLRTSLKDDDFRVRTARGTAPATNPFILVNPNGTDFRRSGDRFNTESLHVTASFRL